MGYEATVHDQAIPLKTYRSSDKVKANIVISQKQEGFTYADMGFERLKDGSLRLHADHIDIKKLDLAQLKQRYTKAFIAKRIKLMGTQFLMGEDEIEEDGTMKLKVKVMEL